MRRSYPVAGTTGIVTTRKFQSLVESLLWLVRCKRPDIAFAVHKSSRRAHAPTISDWKLSKKVLRYLGGTKQLRLRMRGDGASSGPESVVGYSDAGFAADKSDRKSVTGGIVAVSGMAVSWVCRKQTGISPSTMEAESTAASVMARECWESMNY